jgi:hypothetical protein
MKTIMEPWMRDWVANCRSPEEGFQAKKSVTSRVHLLAPRRFGTSVMMAATLLLGHPLMVARGNDDQNR